jgi:hypothetical protein
MFGAHFLSVLPIKHFVFGLISFVLIHFIIKLLIQREFIFFIDFVIQEYSDSFGCTVFLRTITVTSGFKFNSDPDLIGIIHKNTSQKL